MVLSEVPSVYSPVVIRDVLHRALQTACSDLYPRANTVPPLHTGLERPGGSRWPRSCGKKWGRSSPVRCFVRVQDSSSRTAQPLALYNLHVAVEVTRGVPDTVNRVFHAPVTVASISGRTERSPRTKQVSKKMVGSAFRSEICARNSVSASSPRLQDS